LPLETPFGIFYTPNITADESAGIGSWSEADFLRALREGVAPDGSHFYPAFPYTSYTRMTAEDARAAYAYLRSQPTSEQVDREHDIAWYLRWRFAAEVWQWLFFTPGEFTPDRERSATWNRGAYIAQALGHCSECHTPRNFLGAPNPELAYAGNPDGPDGELVPNITPDRETGIGDWSREALDLFLHYGELPDGEYTSGSMGNVINGLGKLSDDDRAALIDYLRALPPIRNSVGR
jgi:mono/diheme cytochrome c family protein